MALGGGKYEEVATLTRARTGGGVVLLVVDGFLGPGFSVQFPVHMLDKLLALPAVLRQVADQIERDNAEMTRPG